MTNQSHPWWNHLLALLLWPLQLLVFGATFAGSWKWFAVGPLGAPMIGFADACGIGLLVSFLLFPFARSPAFEEATPMMKPIISVLIYLTLYGIGYLIHLCQ